MADLDVLFGGNETTAEQTQLSKEDWQILREQNRAQAYEMLEEATTALADPEPMKQYLDVQSRFDRYSVSNVLLIAKQCPTATRLADFKTWQEQGASIQKGQKAISILEPREITKQNGEKGTFYDVKKVFDISQTTAEQTPPPVKKADEKRLIKALMRTSPVEIRINNQLSPDLNAMYSPQDKAIYVRQGMNGADIFKAVAREIILARSDKGDGHMAQRFAVSCVAYMVCKRSGIEPLPIQEENPMKDMDPKDIRKAMKIVRDEANSITGEMEKTLRPKSRDER